MLRDTSKEQDSITDTLVPKKREAKRAVRRTAEQEASGRASGRRPASVYWLITRNENSRLEVLTLSLADGEEVLPVFSYEEEAHMFLSLGQEGFDTWQIRESTIGELISVLYGPCAGVKRVALDPLPEMITERSVGLVSLDRERFANLVLRGKEPPLEHDFFYMAVGACATAGVIEGREGEKMAEKKILIVEDDPAARDIVSRALSREGMYTQAVEDGEKALKVLKEAEQQTFDLVLLDAMLPKVDGFSVCRELREEDGVHRKVPVVMLSVRNDETSVVVALEVGADDYVTKPFSPSELVSRVRAHLRRRRMNAKRGSSEQLKLEFPGLEIDLLKQQVLVEGKTVRLTAKEFEVLKLLASQPGRAYSREQILCHLWGGKFFGETRAADVHVQHLRKKIEPDPRNPRYIHTVRGFGYKFAELQL